MRLRAADTRTPHALRPLLQQGINIRLPRLRLRCPGECSVDAGTVRLFKRPELALGHHPHCCEYNATLAEPHQTQRLASVAFTQGNLTALPHHLDLSTAYRTLCHLLHGVMLSCLRAESNPV